MSERIFLRLDDHWAIGADDLQWMLYRHSAHKTRGGQWSPVWFIRSHKRYLVQGLIEKAGRSRGEAERVLAGLPPTFDEWKAAQSSAVEAALPAAGRE